MKADKIDTRKVVKALKKQKMQLLLEWLSQREQKLFRIGYTYLKRGEDVEDALQNTVLRVFDNISKLKEPVYFETWLIRIFINECKQMIRINQKTVPLSGYKEAAEDSHGMRRVEIDDLLSPIDEPDRTYIVMKYMAGFSYREISEVFEEKESTVKTRVHRSLKQVRAREERRSSHEM
ncbi:sigma-70 family RNA polymerase sigma factor [Salipaludibacillus daqingensis]|uniref:sigma-70 family RNA polymerase sigma factor n=1 Tax=Salipaludibacillus daqingensis TaxID=3041001 RepID=UPI002474FD7C|nr:sigma-70 family RNA polymerase sigma factor [Salipaludibacillus daqingensis]